MQAKLTELKTLLTEASDLRAAQWVLDWDQSTYMPAGGAPARARHAALLARLAQERATDPRIGHLLDELQPYTESLPDEHPEAALVRVARRDYERNIKVPPAFMGQVYQLGAETYSLWAKARPENDFAALQPYLERILDNSRKLADFFPGYEHIADPLINYADYGMKATTLRQLFTELRKELVPLVQQITTLPPADDSCLHRQFDKAGQLRIGEELARLVGYDFERGRLDLTHHPFTTRFSDGDVRITTRVNETDLSDCLFSVIHEAGHAMYEQGIRPDFNATPLGTGTSAGVHESQSRLWEYRVGHSLEFWEFFYPQLQKTFPGQFNRVPLETFHRAINKVELDRKRRGFLGLKELAHVVEPFRAGKRTAAQHVIPPVDFTPSLHGREGLYKIPSRPTACPLLQPATNQGSPGRPGCSRGGGVPVPPGIRSAPGRHRGRDYLSDASPFTRRSAQSGR